MAVKKTSSHKTVKHVSPKEPPVDQIPDVFDEDSTATKPLMVEVEDVTVDVEEPIESPQVSTESDLPSPSVPPMQQSESILPKEEPKAEMEMAQASTFTVHENGAQVEQKLPSFFLEVPPVQPAPPEVVEAPKPADIAAFESLVPQAFVGEAREVVTEAKKEKKGLLVTVFIILGMILVAVGVVGLYVVSTKKSTPGPVPTPVVTPEVIATPTPTPTIIINTATTSGSLTTAITKLKVNVLNGTTTKGLAAKEASVLKTAGYTIGTVGNGDPTLAGTITVPTGKSDLATGIQSALSGFTFTVKEDPNATEITVVLGQPQ